MYTIGFPLQGFFLRAIPILRSFITASNKYLLLQKKKKNDRMHKLFKIEQGAHLSLYD